MMVEKERTFTERELDECRRHSELVAENRLLKKIVEQKCDIELEPKMDLIGSD